jgi:hypothetical protein
MEPVTDNKFILQYCLFKGMVPSSFIRQGSRITYMRFEKFNIRFIDSLHFFLQPLKALSETYNIDTLKGFFPHHFNTPENQNYIGEIPSEEMFGVKNMQPEDYHKIVYKKDDNGRETKEIEKESGFLPWYREQKNVTWNFKEEMIKYCRADVELLSKTVLKFRKMFKDKLDTDPFRYTTLASLCMGIYLNKFLPERTIVGNSHEKQDSIISREWLSHLNSQNNNNIFREYPIWVKPKEGINIHENKIGKDFCQYYNNFKRPFTVDGYDEKTKTIYQFQGCYWHGCRKCNPENVVKYNKTMEQNNLFKANGYNLKEIWECEWNEIKKDLPNKTELEEEARQQNINIRDALFGGRTEGFKKYYKCNKKQKIFYFDIVSLYPTVNALDEYAVGYGKYVKITEEDILNGNFIGLVKCDVQPPKDLHVPVLPDNTNGKLLFHLNEMKNKTFASVELKLALEKDIK